MFRLVNTLFRIYEVIVIIRVLFSWIHVSEFNPVAQWVYRLTEPLLDPLRRLLPTERIGIDFSPFLLLLALSLVQRVVLGILFNF